MEPANQQRPSAVEATSPGRGQKRHRRLIVRRERRNLALMAAHQIVFRIGWIFKTESVIIPAFLDWLTGPGGGMLRGMLPVINRSGQSLPPVFLADWLRARPLKKRSLAVFTAGMGLAFLPVAAACLLLDARRFAWMPWLFLILYGAFFVCNGMYHLSFGTVQGKLIRPWRRGRLLLVSTFYGSFPAMLVAWWLLPGWLDQPERGFGFIFLSAAVCFLGSSLLALAIFEPADAAASFPLGRWRGSVADLARTLRADANLRRTTVVAMLFAGGLIVLPHYQALALQQLRVPMGMLMVFAVTQNAAVGIFSLFIGPMADRWGNRLTLGVLIFGSTLPPLLAVSMAVLGGSWAAKTFWLVYIPLGVTPLVLRILINYTLEICQPAEHPRYLSTVSLCLAMPFVASPLVGGLVDLLGFTPIFLSTAALMFVGGLLTFSLDEPRHRVSAEERPPVIDGEA